MAGKLGNSIGIKEELIKEACNLAMKAHLKSPQKPYLYEKSRNGAVFAFPGTWSVSDWYSQSPFGETSIKNIVDHHGTVLYPSLKSIGVGDAALVNEAFARRFQGLLSNSSLAKEVDKALSDKKQIVFAGHSSGGPMAIFAALWFFEKYIRPNTKQMPPFCVTFGSPLVGDRIFSHALRRENWARYFIHFITRYDIVPRIMFAPLSSIEKDLVKILPLVNPKTPHSQQEFVQQSNVASTFFLSVMRSTLTVASHAACNLMECTNLLLETVASFIQFAPYRPFGTYIISTKNKKLVVIENPDAVLQLLFYSAQLSSEAEAADVAQKSLREHLIYESEVKESLDMQNVVQLNNLVDVPLCSSDKAYDAATSIKSTLDDLGLSARARLCLRAAGELEKQKMKNKEKIDSNKKVIVEELNMIQEYQTICQLRQVGYYDAFKLQKDVKDFNANIKRLELAGKWDEIVEMLKRYELPDEFEGQKEWIDLGTRFRRLVEPLDIANYYRHLKNDDTGPYMVRARPKRYRYTQRWREHAERMREGSSSESCFWAEVEELRAKPFAEVKERILSLEKQAEVWIRNKLLSDDIFLPETTFAKWWKTLPIQSRPQSWGQSI